MKEGKIVVTDRSEIDLLCYVVEYSDEATIEKRKKYIEDRTIAHRLWAGNRIFLDADPKETWENLRNRKHKSQYGPASLEEMEISSKAQQEAEQHIESLLYLGEIQIIKEKVNRIENKTERK